MRVHPCLLVVEQLSCKAADTEREATETGGVTYVRGEAVDQWLLGLPEALSAETVARLAAAVAG